MLGCAAKPAYCFDHDADHMPARTDGKIIKAGSVSVQTNQTYEENFALEMEKAKVSSPAPIVVVLPASVVSDASL